MVNQYKVAQFGILHADIIALIKVLSFEKVIDEGFDTLNGQNFEQKMFKKMIEILSSILALKKEKKKETWVE